MAYDRVYSLYFIFLLIRSINGHGIIMYTQNTHLAELNYIKVDSFSACVVESTISHLHTHVCLCDTPYSFLFPLHSLIYNLCAFSLFLILFIQSLFHHHHLIIVIIVIYLSIFSALLLHIILLSKIFFCIKTIDSFFN